MGVAVSLGATRCTSMPGRSYNGSHEPSGAGTKWGTLHFEDSLYSRSEASGVISIGWPRLDSNVRSCPGPTQVAQRSMAYLAGNILPSGRSTAEARSDVRVGEFTTSTRSAHEDALLLSSPALVKFCSRLNEDGVSRRYRTDDLHYARRRVDVRAA